MAGSRMFRIQSLAYSSTSKCGVFDKRHSWEHPRPTSESPLVKTKTMTRPLLAASALALAACLPSMKAQVVRINPGDFTPQASVITFSEPGSTTNPVYTLATASLGSVTVSFGQSFVGQTVTGGGVRTITGLPTGPLTLNAISTFITNDGSNPSSPVLSGTPTFNGPISMMFSTEVAFVGLDGGFFNAIGGTSIQAFDGMGNSLGLVTNSQLGIEFLGLTTASGQNVIRGLSFYITGSEPAGFAIDNVTFGSARELVNPPGQGAVPEPSTYGIFGAIALLGVVALRRRMAK